MADKQINVKIKLTDGTSAGAASAKQNVDKIGKQTKQTENAFKRLGAAAGVALGEITTGARSASSAMATMVASVSKAHIAIIAATAALAPLVIALGAVNKALSRGREEYANQALANQQLETVWKTMGRAIPVDKIYALASAMQSTSTFGDDLILQGVKMLATFPRITDDMMPKAIKAMVDFASFGKSAGVTIQSAAAAIGKVSMGRFGDVERTGITFEGATKKLNDFNMALDDMNRQMGGQAEATTRTFAGQLDMLKNSWGDLLEGFGELQDEPLQAFFSTVRQAVEDLTAEFTAWLKTDDAKEFKSVWVDVATAVGEVIGQLLKDVAGYVKEWGKYIASFKREDIIAWATRFANGIRLAANAVLWLGDKLATVYKWMQKLNPMFYAWMGIVDWFGGGKAKEPFDDMADGAETAAKQMAKMTKEAEEMSGALATAGAAGAGGTGVGAFEQQIKEQADSFKTFMKDVRANIKDLDKEDYKGFGEQAQSVIDNVKSKLQELAGTTVNTTGESSDKLDELTKKFGDLQQGGVEALRGLASQATQYLKQIENEIEKLEKRIETIKKKTASDIASLDQKETDAVRKLQRSTMTDEQKLGESVDYISTQTEKAKAEAAKGTVEGYKEAQKILEKVNQEAQQLTQYQKIYDSAGDKQWGRDWGTGIVQQTSDMMKQYRQAQGDLEAGEYEKEKDALEERKKGYEGIRENIQKAITDAGAITLEIQPDTEAFSASMQEAINEASGQTIEIFAQLKGLDEQISAAAQKFNELTKGGWGGTVGSTVAGAVDEYGSTVQPGVGTNMPDMDEYGNAVNNAAEKLNNLDIPKKIEINVTKQEGLGVSVSTGGGVNDLG